MRRLTLIHSFSLLLMALLFSSYTLNEEAIQENNSGFLPFADPFILCYNNVYYAYGTSSDDGFEVYYSEDLEWWTKYSEMLLKKEDSYGDKWFWAPEVYYNDKTKLFYLYYSANEHICVATSTSPLGPFKQEVKQPMREEKSIDSSLFVDDDGTPYLYFVRFTDGNVIWMAELEDDWSTIKEETLRKCIDVTQDWETKMAKVIEGPSLLKHNDLYYLIYSANHYQSPDYGVGVAISNSPRGPWEKYENNPVLHKPKDSLIGVGHGAYFTDEKRDYKYVFHAHHSTEKIHPRVMYVVDMKFKGSDLLMDKSSIIKAKVVPQK
ncbi:MAG: glycoside hydrolase family 43 protein [Bacteroides sp.]|nr:glycoside hydrolase family 43 protein [Bacteroides sp.]